jgi:hypothetical protein
MIADALSDAVEEIDSFFAAPLFRSYYPEELRVRIVGLRNAMNAMRIELDASPARSSADAGNPT